MAGWLRAGWLRAALVTALVAVLTGGAAPAVGRTAASCPGAQIPPPPAATAEVHIAPAPLPWPAEPVGGPLLGGCGEVVARGAPPAPPVGAASWLVADLDTGDVLAARAPHARHRPASTLKVLTALVALRTLKPDTVVVGTPEDARIVGSRAGIGPGGRYTVAQLLAGLLLDSGNDTAQALAREMGGVPATLAAMTATARGLGARDTWPATPSGLDGAGMSSSAYDLALFFRAALAEPGFAETIAARSVEFPGFGDQPGFVLSNSSTLLARYPGTLGGKAGFTRAARHTLVGAAQRDGRRLVMVLMRGEQAPVPMWQQAAALLDHGFALPPGTAPIGELADPAPAATPGSTGDLVSGSPDDTATADAATGDAATGDAPGAGRGATPGTGTGADGRTLPAWDPPLTLAALIGAAAVVVGLLAVRRRSRHRKPRPSGHSVR